MNDENAPPADDKFRILVCIDGSDEGYQCLRYAAKLGSDKDADIVLVYVRPLDQGQRSGGLEVRVARENMLKWGLELPGIKYLKRGRDLLVELGVMSEEWMERAVHTGVEGDPLGDNKIEYVSDEGKMVVLKLKVASDVASGILEQWELGNYDLIILGASGRGRRTAKSFWDPAIAEKVAIHAPCSVIVARELEVGHGHLICVDGSERAKEMIRTDAVLARRSQSPISLISVALDEEERPQAEQYVAEAKALVEELGVEVTETLVRVGNPVQEIIEAGPDYSLIVMSESGTSRIKRFFMGSVAFKVLENAYNSVMIVR